jgi:REP element-mobilizing transposase RayT
MTYKRALLIDPETPCFYHITSRCVRRAWLCGEDPLTNRSYEHRRAWVEERLLFLAEHFTVDIYAYAVMSNHYHIVLHYDPTAADKWSDEEVAFHWLEIHPPRRRGQIVESEKAGRLKLLLADQQKLQRCRELLGSLSWFMRCINYTIACRANKEDQCTGHFWEGRFKSIALLDESAVLACMVYVDLNPVRARISEHFHESEYTSINRRLQQKEDESSALMPIHLYPRVAASSIQDSVLSINLNDYQSLLRSTSSPLDAEPQNDPDWIAQVFSMQHQYRAYGSRDKLRRWAQRIGQSRIKTRSSKS